MSSYKDELAELCECNYPKGSSSSLGSIGSPQKGGKLKNKVIHNFHYKLIFI
jgi:hypothetical protein